VPGPDRCIAVGRGHGGASTVDMTSDCDPVRSMTAAVAVSRTVSASLLLRMLGGSPQECHAAAEG
jgi:hypothetical protein